LVKYSWIACSEAQDPAWCPHPRSKVPAAQACSRIARRNGADPEELRGAAVGLLSLLRNEGGSVGTSLAQTFQERRDQFHTLRLGEYLDPFNAAANSFVDRGKEFFFQLTGDPIASQQVAWQELANLRQQQAASLAYFDCFWIFAMLTLALVFVPLFMKRSVAQKGVGAPAPQPVVNFRPLRERNFAGCCIIISCAYVALYAASTTLPGLLQSLFWLRCAERRAGHVAGRNFCGPGNAHCRPPPREGYGCPVANRNRVVGHDRRELLDVPAEPGHQPQGVFWSTGSGRSYRTSAPPKAHRSDRS
jgi:hypothetical protein